MMGNIEVLLDYTSHHIAYPVLNTHIFIAYYHIVRDEY
jgi:hypothetical protein